MYYLNGLRIGGIYPSSPYAAGNRHLRRLLFCWLKHVVGWTEIDKSGSNWDNPDVAGAADGTTDGYDAEKFTSATGGFNAIDPYSSGDRYHLMITGFSDSTRDGFYEIQRVEDDNTVFINKAYSGVHTDGFPLGESGLSWKVYNFKNNAKIPANGDWWVLEGTGTGGAFHVYCLSDNSESYTEPNYQVSPYPDWDAVAHAWKTPARYTARTLSLIDDSARDSCYVFAVADLTHCALFARIYSGDIVSSYGSPMALYFGDIVPFRPSVDTRPVVCIAHQTSGWNWWGALTGGSVMMIDGLNNQTQGLTLFPSLHGSSGTFVLDGTRRTRSLWSGRYVRVPLVVANLNSGSEEIRGQLKSIEGFHSDLQVAVATPFGSSRDRLAFPSWSMPWNGSKQYRYIF